MRYTVISLRHNHVFACLHSCFVLFLFFSFLFSFAWCSLFLHVLVISLQFPFLCTLRSDHTRVAVPTCHAMPLETLQCMERNTVYKSRSIWHCIILIYGPFCCRLQLQIRSLREIWCQQRTACVNSLILFWISFQFMQVVEVKKEGIDWAAGQGYCFLDESGWSDRKLLWNKWPNDVSISFSYP